MEVTDVIYNIFTCSDNFPLWRLYLGWQCDIINVRNFHEILRYLSKILPTPQRVYLFKLYDKPIIKLLTNDLTNIFREISKTRLVLWMVYTCNVKALEEVAKLGNNECTLHRWPRSPEMNDCTRSYQYILSHLVDSKLTTYWLKHRKCSSTSRITRLNH